jgi:hypothetical protein
MSAVDALADETDLMSAAAVVVDRVSMCFNPGRSNQVDALVDIDLSIDRR